MKRFLLLTSIIPLVIFLKASGITPCQSYELLYPLVQEGANPGHLSPDGLSFLCGLSSGEEPDGREMLYQWRRASLDDPWQGPARLRGKINRLKDSTDNMQPTVSDDGLLLVFVRNSTGSWDDNNLWLATRSRPDAPFNKLRAIEELNTYGVEAYPFLSPNGERLYFTTDEGLMVARYDREKGWFMEPEKVELSGDLVPMASCLLEDELTILVSDGEALFYAERLSVNESFGELHKIDIPPDLGFVSAPSLDPGGNLYLYQSVENYGNYEEEQMDNEVDDELLEDEEMTDEDYGSLTRIIVLGCKGGD